MRWSWPSWVAIVLGALLLGTGLIVYMTVGGSATATTVYGMANALIVAGAILLAAGLHARQSSCGDCGYGGGGCGCCGDGCSCGDCSDCGKGGCSCCKEGCRCGDCGACSDTGHSHGEHEHGEHSH